MNSLSSPVCFQCTDLSYEDLVGSSDCMALLVFIICKVLITDMPSNVYHYISVKTVLFHLLLLIMRVEIYFIEVSVANLLES